METVMIYPNETKTAYWYVNLSGRVYYKVQNKSGSNRLKASWVKGPFGSVESIADLVSSGQTPFLGFGWGKLRISGADSETIVYVTESGKVAGDFPSIHF